MFDLPAALILEYCSYLAAGISVLLLLRCAVSMIRIKKDPEIWGAVEFPNGKTKAITTWESIIGRSRSTDLRLSDLSVNRTHAALQRNSAGKWVIYDLHSSTGTFVNGDRVSKKARVENGDKLRFGEVEIEFTAFDSAERTELQRKRKEPGRIVSTVLSLLLLTLFQMTLVLEHTVTAPEGTIQSILLAYLILVAAEWLCYVVMRVFFLKGFEVEIIAFFLSTVGVSVAASSAPTEMTKTILLFLIALLSFVLLGWWLRSLRRVRAFSFLVIFLSFVFLGLNIIFSEEVLGARNWLTLGGVTLQPSEFIKIGYVYVGSAAIDRLFRKRNLFFFIAFSAILVCGMALIGDFGTALVFFVCFLIISYMRSGSFATVALAISGAVLAALLVITAKPYVLRRFTTWGHAWQDPWGSGYQQVRTMSATASGGWFGRGAGNGWLKDVVAADTDMVFGVVSEELGLIIGLSCLASILLLALFAVRNAATGRSSYYVIAACASVSIMMVQMALNVFGSLDLLPFTGVTFPFVSRGGSSLISCWALLAFIKASDTRQRSSFAIASGLRHRSVLEYEPEEEEDEWEKTAVKKGKDTKNSEKSKTEGKKSSSQKGKNKTTAEKKTASKTKDNQKERPTSKRTNSSKKSASGNRQK